jgi:hypothetical protein
MPAAQGRVAPSCPADEQLAASSISGPGKLKAAHGSGESSNTLLAILQAARNRKLLLLQGYFIGKPWG